LRSRFAPVNARFIALRDTAQIFRTSTGAIDYGGVAAAALRAVFRNDGHPAPVERRFIGVARQSLRAVVKLTRVSALGDLSRWPLVAESR
jgi:hypothetical protein